MMEVGCSGVELDRWGATFVLIIYCVCMVTSRCNQGAAAEADTVGDQQLKRMHLGNSSWSGSNQEISSRSRRNWGRDSYVWSSKVHV